MSVISSQASSQMKLPSVVVQFHRFGVYVLDASIDQATPSADGAVSGRLGQWRNGDLTTPSVF